MNTIRQFRRREYLARHFQNFFPYLTIRKIVNLALNLFEHKLKISTPLSLPPYIKIEPTPLCQLRCPGCVQRKSNYKKQFRNSMQITLNDFKKIVDPLSSTLLGISLSNHGEPLLHNNIAALIEYAHQKKISVSFPTNMSLKLDKASIEKLVRSGLDSILVSLDGASEATYSKYRVGGKFGLVVENVKSIAQTKQRLGLNRPKIIWKFVVLDHNKHEQHLVKKRYRELGFNAYSFVQDRRSNVAREAKGKYKERVRRNHKGCFWLWHAMVVRWDGEVFPCCKRKPFNLGNALLENSLNIWRSEEYRTLRRGFSSARNLELMNPICQTCMGYESAGSVKTNYPINAKVQDA